MPCLLIETGIIVFLIIRLRRTRTHIRILLQYAAAEHERIEPAVHILIELLTDVVNAAARSGDNLHMLAKRLDRILTSSRGEGRTVKDEFLILTDLCQGGLLTWLQMHYPALTRNEIGLCGLILLDMDPASIDRIFGYDHGQTFYNKRGEIRKKLQLDRSTSLERFLKDLSDQLRRERNDFFRQYKEKI